MTSAIGEVVAEVVAEIVAEIGRLETAEISGDG
jgi:hypothetical protein